MATGVRAAARRVRCGRFQPRQVELALFYDGKLDLRRCTDLIRPSDQQGWSFRYTQIPGAIFQRAQVRAAFEHRRSSDACELPLFGKPPPVSANSLFINAQNFRRDVATVATFDRSNCRCGLSLPERLHLFSNHATRLGLGQSTACRKSHESECHHTLGLES